MKSVLKSGIIVILMCYSPNILGQAQKPDVTKYSTVELIRINDAFEKYYSLSSAEDRICLDDYKRQSQTKSHEYCQKLNEEKSSKKVDCSIMKTFPLSVEAKVEAMAHCGIDWRKLVKKKNIE